MKKTCDKKGSTGERNDRQFEHSCLENPMNIMKRQKNMALKDELPRSIGAQDATAEEWRK